MNNDWNGIRGIISTNQMINRRSISLVFSLTNAKYLVASGNKQCIVRCNGLTLVLLRVFPKHIFLRGGGVVARPFYGKNIYLEIWRFEKKGFKVSSFAFFSVYLNVGNDKHLQFECVKFYVFILNFEIC